MTLARIKYALRLCALVCAVWCMSASGQGVPLELAKLELLTKERASLQTVFKGFNRGTKESSYELALRNVSAAAIHAPVYVTIEELSPASVKVKNASGVTTSGVPYFLVSTTDIGADAQVLQELVFSNPNNVRFDFRVQGYATPSDGEPEPLSLEITHPGTLITVGATPIAIEGTINDASAALTVNGAPVSHSGGRFTANVALTEGHNAIVARAVNDRNEEATATISVSLDTTPPYVTIDSPAAGAVLTSATVNVSGLINDIVRGTVSEGQANVTVNGRAASVANRSYFAPQVPLQEGLNTIRVEAADEVGNTGVAQLEVTYRVPQGAVIELSGGQGQAAQIRSELSQPLAVKLLDGEGTAVAGKPVVFRVSQGDGVVGVGQSDEGAAVLATSDANGVAGTRFKVGARAGSGNQRVTARAVGFEGEVVFFASATPKPGDKVSVNSGNNQRGAARQPLPLPFVVVVSDDGANVIEGAQVEFSVVAGDGRLQNGERSFIATTDSDGRASAKLTLGEELGLDVHRVSAELVGTQLSAGFTASALQSGAPGATSISGVVLDNQDRPLPNVTLRVEHTTREARTDEQGRFKVTEVPVGPVRLIADGSTTTVAGEWPTLPYNLVTVSGADNPLPAPVYMVKLDTAHAVTVGAEDKEITLPEVPGFKLTVKAGSVTFPNADRVGLLSVTPVNVSKIPMVPPNGMQPQFIVTIQPSGARFDPPAALELPNVDGHAPGAQVEMYSFDHDLEEFVTIGLGTVSADGTRIASNPGVGVIKAGWHCGSPPGGDGCVAACNVCQVSSDDCTCKAAPNGLIAANLNDVDSRPPGDTPHDCLTPVCSNGTVTQVPDPSDTPFDILPDCRSPQCDGTTIPNDSDLPLDACQACENGGTRPARILSVQAEVEGQPEKWRLITGPGAVFTFRATAITERCTPKFEWNLGEGTKVPGANVTHLYATAAEYTATVTVSCEGCPSVQPQTRTVKVVALEIDRLTEATIPADRSRTKLGVGEEIELLTAPIVPVRWSFDGGPFTAPNAALTFRAPVIAKTVKFTISAPPRLDPVEVLTLNVVAPNLVTMRKIATAAIAPGTMGAAMVLEVTIHPTDVSFANIEIREDDGPPSSVTGYFLAFPQDRPPPEGLRHQASRSWTQVRADNVLAFPDVSGIQGFEPSRTTPRIEWDSGGFNHLIPWRYRVRGGPAEHVFVNLLSTKRLQGPEGKVTVTKGGACTSRTPDDVVHPCTP